MLRSSFRRRHGLACYNSTASIIYVHHRRRWPMYFLYVDESGDTGMVGSPSQYFSLSGIVIHELMWNATVDAVIRFRRELRNRYGLRVREEIHAAHVIHKPGKLARIRKDVRLRLLRDVLEFEATLPAINIINVVIDKAKKAPDYNVFENAWQALIQRFHNTIGYRNFPGPKNPRDFGLLVVDQTDEPTLRKLTRRMKRFNPVPNMGFVGNRQIPIETIVEDPIHRDSRNSHLIQLADVNAYFLHQKQRPCQYIRVKGARNFFDRLSPVLCRVAATRDPQGIVRL